MGIAGPIDLPRGIITTMSDEARNSTPYHDTARHPLTIPQAVELFAELGVPRSKRSVQRFCEQGHLDCVRIKGARGDQFFINRESVERYAVELRQIDAVASISAEPRHDAPQHDAARSSAPEGAPVPEVVAEPAPANEPERERAPQSFSSSRTNCSISASTIEARSRPSIS